ncbi:MAG: sulfite exporter TauE/SafE family protein [Pseudoalteromonas distincta]|uniref:sulfite exporter TauE/SafE family protein n=1 Tax=Pseudoalteromonas distincta TaxID=77608 RepID=UPI003F97E483
MPDIVLVYCILIIGACLQCVIGFGLGLLCVPFLYWLLPELVPAPMILNALLITTLLAIKHRGEIDVKQTGYSIFGGVIGVLCAAAVMLYVDSEQYRLLLGGCLLLAAGLSLTGWTPKLTMLSNLIASILSGFIGTTTSAGGAPMGLLYQAQNRDKIKANLSIFFVFINLFGILALLVTGYADFNDILLFLKCLPAIIIGWGASYFVNNSINEKATRRLIILVASFSGLALIFIHH